MARRLAAILAADVVGYSRLMGADETGTLQRLTELRQQVLEPLVADHNGRIVKLMGDGILVEFASVVDAVTCAVAWQNDVAQREVVADEDKRLRFRIGINLGDVIAEKDDIHGDGVNIATRLEGLAEPGGICLSGDAYRQAKNKVKINFEDLGEHDLKNITEPVGVWRWAHDQLDGVKEAQYKLDLSDERLRRGEEPIQISTKSFQLLRLFVNNPNRLLTKDEILNCVWPDVFVSEGLVKEYVHDLRLALGDEPKQPRFIETVHGRGYRFLGGIEVLSTTAESRSLPNKPSIAVLAFANLSGDTEEEYFADGLSEEIITELSRFRSLFVIARNSSFTYKGRSVNVREVGRDLGVRYLVEGSVRRADDRVRITAQLIETTTGRHIWADRYDRELKDIFLLQDEITRTIAAAIEPELSNVERDRSRTKEPGNLDAWDWYQRGLWHMYQETQGGNKEARRHFEQAIELSPEFAPAHAALAYVRCFDFINGYTEISEDLIEEEYRRARKAISLDERDAMAHVVLGRIQLLRCKHEDAIEELETALRLNPNFADAYHGLGLALTMSGRPEEALPQFENAVRLSPYDPRASSFHEMRSWALIVMGRHVEAAEAARIAVRKPNADIWAYSTLGAALGHLGHIKEAGSALMELLRRKPDFSVGFVRRFVFYNRNPDHLELYLDGLRKAGLPE